MCSGCLRGGGRGGVGKSATVACNRRRTAVGRVSICSTVGGASFCGAGSSVSCGDAGKPSVSGGQIWALGISSSFVGDGDLLEFFTGWGPPEGGKSWQHRRAGVHRLPSGERRRRAEAGSPAPGRHPAERFCPRLVRRHRRGAAARRCSALGRWTLGTGELGGGRSTSANLSPNAFSQNGYGADRKHVGIRVNSNAAL